MSFLHIFFLYSVYIPVVRTEVDSFINLAAVSLSLLVVITHILYIFIPASKDQLNGRPVRGKWYIFQN
jgi:hypothetical protein